MFAVRFDPNSVGQDVGEVGGNLSGSVKRTRDLDDDGSDEEEEEEEIVSEMAEKDDLGSSESDVEMEEIEVPKKHSSIMSRFKQTISLQDQISSKEEVDGLETSAEHVNALEQIPQPAIVRDRLSKQAANEHKSVAWLNTTKIHYNNTMVRPFSDFSDHLHPRLLQNIQKHFSSECFPIQTALLENVLPVINFSLEATRKHLTRRVGDVLVNASTGSGKTLAYSIPVAQLLFKRTVNRLRVLIIVPTKLLINQVFDTISKLSQGSGLIVSISKLENSVREEHKKFLQSEPDILISTPGRLVDHLQMKSLSMKNLQVLILDEADHLLNQSFQNWCPELMQRIVTDKHDERPGNVIKMIFSATLTTNTEKLHGLNLHNPKLFLMDSVKLYNLPAKLQEFMIRIPTAKSSYKPLILLHLLDYLKRSKTLVFVKSNEASMRLACLLNILIEKGLGQHHDIQTINSNSTKAENKRLVTEFAKADCTLQNKILITTDLMSRGIDINDISDVINYDPPISSQQYVHRCGRTARAHSNGNAYNFLVGKGEKDFWERHINEDLSRDATAPAQLPETVDDLISISNEEEQFYKESLIILKDKATGKP
ncbi:hypothetical protein HG537_0F00460 [Torulaspora globosa]|uniref:ATP-dependent RNA helicase n=1 Tax=Torulaspora globosa TaxID=48254 RepID=A0A7H9HXP0_9SACH|nr:hypothetical protein HG537_0F00460 [Torulaspora sp. CBS 2947]